MKALITLLVLISSCSQLKVDGKNAEEAKIIQHPKYKEVKGLENVLRNTESATLMIDFKPIPGAKDEVQDMISVSVGNTNSNPSRASLRIEDEGYLVGIARAQDSDRGSVVISKEKVAPGKYHTAALVVDYAQNGMDLFLDGKRLETKKFIKFTAPRTSDTPSTYIAIGAEDDGKSNYFKGELKDPRIWKRKLTPEEIEFYSGQ